jgi:hypothetical protein
MVLATFAFVSGQERSSMSWPDAIERLPSPAGPNGGQPQLSSSARGLLLSWVERDGQKATLRFAERPAGD